MEFKTYSQTWFSTATGYSGAGSPATGPLLSPTFSGKKQSVATATAAKQRNTSLTDSIEATDKRSRIQSTKATSRTPTEKAMALCLVVSTAASPSGLARA